MLKLGIVGAENSHCLRIAEQCNIKKSVACRAVMVWGEAPRFAKAAAAAGQIPTIVRDWREMLGNVDGVMIDHRHAKYHAEVATFFVNHGVPCFVDKPFTFTLAEGKRLCALSREKHVPITSFSVKVFHQTFKDFRKALKKVGRIRFFTSTGPVDLKSKYGGVFFYGIHQVDPVIELFGNQVDTACLRRHGQDGLATLAYRNGPIVTINCVKDRGGFHASVVGDKETLGWKFTVDPNPYIASARLFTKMFRTGKAPIPYERMLAPVAVLEALAKSLKLGRPVKLCKAKLD